MYKHVLGITTALLLVVSCGDANRSYVRKAVRIMDKDGLFAQGEQWEEAREKALTARPATLEEAQDLVREAGKVAGGKHTFLQTEQKVAQDAVSEEWEMPSVTLQEDGVAEIPFAASDVNTEFVGLVEAIDGSGQLGAQLFSFRVLKQ